MIDYKGMFDAIFIKSVECVESAVTAILSVHTQHAESGIELVERLVNRENVVINLGFCNDSWQGILTCGGSYEDLQAIVHETEMTIVIDALGEVLNTTAGLIAAMPETMEAFGELNQTTPVTMEGGTFYPKATGVQIDLLIASSRLRFGFAIRKVGVFQ